MHQTSYPVLIDARPAQAAELAPLAFAGFAHFTAMQIRARKVKGLDLHLKRLHDASIGLFGRALPDAAILDSLRMAIESGPADMSLSATIYQPAGEFSVRSRGTEPAILVRTGPPSNGPAGPLRLDLVEHERHQASIKHVGEGAKTWYLHQAATRGFDDAAFIDRQGRLSEATIWNLVFWDGATVIWPRAEILRGTMMGMIQRQLERMGVAQQQREIRRDDVGALAGAAVMNSWTPGVAVSALGTHTFEHPARLMDLLREAHAAEPAEEV